MKEESGWVGSIFRARTNILNTIKYRNNSEDCSNSKEAKTVARQETAFKARMKVTAIAIWFGRRY